MSPFQLLFTEEVTETSSLPDELRAIYPGDWHLPRTTSRPYIYSNFVTSRDGRISYNDPDHPGGGPVSLFSAHDRWLMALLRMRAHAVLIGDVTLDIEPDHDWTSEFIYPLGAEDFKRIRQAEGYADKPLLVLLSYDGKLNLEAACWQDEELSIVLATTQQGAVNFGSPSFPARVDVLALGEESVDLQRLVHILFQAYGVRHLLCEGGATTFANLLDAHLIDEEFVTLSPTFVGRSADRFRPSYTENVTWLPQDAPRSIPFSLHRVDDLLFLRTRCTYKGERL